MSVASRYELDQRERCRVSTPPTDFYDSCVAAGAVFESGSDSIKQFAHHRLILNHTEGPATGMQAPLLAQRDYAIGPPSKLLCLRIGGSNLLVAQQSGNEVTHQSPAMTGGTVEFSARFEVAHGLRRLLAVARFLELISLREGERLILMPNSRPISWRN